MNKEKFLKYFNISLVDLLVFLIIFCSRSTFLFGTSQLSIIVKHIVPMGVFFSILFFICLKNKVKIFSNKIIVLAAMIFCLLLLMLITMDFSLNMWYEIVVLLIAFMLVMIFPRDEIEKSFIKAMFIICAYSLFVYFLTLFFPSFVASFPIINNTSEWEFHLLGLSNAPTIYIWDSWPRNFAIFREPGVFVCFISLAFILCIKHDDLNVIKIAVFFVSLLSTLSTAGFVVIVVCFFALLYKINSLKFSFYFSIIAILILIILKMFTTFLDVDGPVFAKLLVQSGSYRARMGSISQNFELMMKYPVFGAGWANSKDFFVGSEINQHNTSTFLFYFSCYGVGIGILYCLGLFTNLFIKDEPFLTVLCILILTMSFNSERICYDIILASLIFYGLFDVLDFCKKWKGKRMLAKKK